MNQATRASATAALLATVLLGPATAARAAIVGPVAAGRHVVLRPDAAARGAVVGSVAAARRVVLRPAAAGRGAQEAGGSDAHGVRASVRPLDVPAVSLDAAPSRWQPGHAFSAGASATVHLPVAGSPLLDAGAVSTRAGRGTAEARVGGLRLLSASTLAAGVIQTRCGLSRSGISGGTAVVHLRVARQATNPGVNTAITMAGVATGTVDRQTATYDPRTGKLTWTIRGLDLSLSSGALGKFAGGRVVVAESTCSGIVTLDAIRTAGMAIVPGHRGTPTVTVTGDGEVAAPNTVITIPAPPAGYRLGRVTTSAGGTCTRRKTRIRCTGVTVPGSGSVAVSLPVTLSASTGNAANWAPRSGSITAVSTPIAALSGTTIRVAGSGPLVAVDHSAGAAGTFGRRAPAPVAGRSGWTPPGARHRPPGAATGSSTPPTGTPERTDPSGGGPDPGANGVADPTAPPARVPSDYSAAAPQAGREVSVPLVLTVMLAAGALVTGIVARHRPRHRRGGTPPGTR